MIDRDTLAYHIDQIEAADAQRIDAAERVRARYIAAKDAGLSPKALRVIVRERRLPIEERQVLQNLLDEYRAALGTQEFETTELARAAVVPLNLDARQLATPTRTPRKVIFDADSPNGR